MSGLVDKHAFSLCHTPTQTYTFPNLIHPQHSGPAAAVADGSGCQKAGGYLNLMTAIWAACIAKTYALCFKFLIKI